MSVQELIVILDRLGVCAGLLDWLRTLPPTATAADAWNGCGYGEWLVLIVGALHRRGFVTRQTLALVACAATRPALVHVPAGEARPLNAIETAERGAATREEVRGAAIGARAAAVAADGDHGAAGAAEAAALAAFARVAYLSADAAYDASRAAHAASRAASDAAADSAGHATVRAQRRAEIATAVRAAVPWSIIESALREVSR